MSNDTKLNLLLISAAVTIVCVLFHFYADTNNPVVFWLTSVVGTINVTIAALPAIDLMLDKMY